MTRASKYDAKVIKALAEAIRLGATKKLACKYAGIGESTLYEWLADPEEHADLIVALDQAEGAAAVGWLAQIEAAAQSGQWQAAAWKLERLYKETYGRTIIEQQLSGTVQVNHGLDIPDDNPEAASAARALIRALSLPAGPGAGGGVPDAGGPGVSGE